MGVGVRAVGEGKMVNIMIEYDDEVTICLKLQNEINNDLSR